MKRPRVLWAMVGEAPPGTPAKPQLNYQEKVMRLLRDYQPKPGESAEVIVKHDSWCACQNGRAECNCDPEVILDIRKLTGEQSKN